MSALPFLEGISLPKAESSLNLGGSAAPGIALSGEGCSSEYFVNQSALGAAFLQFGK